MKQLKIISIWNPKGGQGKSMLAINLAAAACDMNLTPLVICQDQQGTSMLYHQEGNLPFQVIGNFPQEKPKVDLVIIDHQASDWDVPDTQLLVMPLKPARDQFATYADAYARAEKAGKDIVTVVTDGQAHRASERETSDYLEGQGAYVIPSSGVFSRAASDYRTIFDEELNKAYKIRDRRREMSSLLAGILMEQVQETKGKKAYA